MKKRLFTILVFISFFVLLTSCKNNSERIVGLWLMNETIEIDTTDKTLDEIESLKEEYKVTSYVDNYTSDKVVDHLNDDLEKKTPYYKDVKLYPEYTLGDYLKVVLVYKRDDAYFLKGRNNGYPNVLKKTLKYNYEINNYHITIVYYYMEENAD